MQKDSKSFTNKTPLVSLKPERCLSKPPGAVFLPVLTVLHRMWRAGIGFCHSYFLRCFSEGALGKALKDYLLREDPKLPANYIKMMEWGIINGLVLIV